MSAAAPAPQSAPAPQRATNELVAAGLTPANLAELKASGFRVKAGASASDVVTLEVPRGVSLADARLAVGRVNASAASDFNHFYYTDGGPNPGCTEGQCAPQQMIGWTAPDVAACGPLPTIGMVDTAIDLENEALKGQAIETLVPEGLVRGRDGARDTSHGTAVAAIIAGRADSSTPGLLPGARILAVDVFQPADAQRSRTDVTGLTKAIELLVSRGVKIINLSLSGPDNEVLRRVIEKAQDAGVIFIAAAGNGGPGAKPAYPAAYDRVIAVTAVDADMKAYARASRGSYVDVAAPGVGIKAAGSAEPRSGTSYATPFVAAAVTLLRASAPEAEVEDFHPALFIRARDLGPVGRDPVYGWGLLQTPDCGTPAAPLTVSTSQDDRSIATVE
ncbi:protease [Agaricicola taiwanensis]|uniref:Protease n=1 Tax=Agaricicola taiwanensis TaxID=591372 RepID=A0A8J2YMZ4_9RHOB|nr:protease [Agaricicola taiwanensis]